MRPAAAEGVHHKNTLCKQVMRDLRGNSREDAQKGVTIKRFSVNRYCEILEVKRYRMSGQNYWTFYF
jgi:hypothetical protein